MPIKQIVFLAVILVALSTRVRAQTTKEFSGPFPKTVSPAEAEEPVHQKKFYTRHRTKHSIWKRTKVTHTAQYEFYKRVERAAKEHQRILRKLHRPQYSDFSYYGHRHKPKKHPPGKMKYCKECGIRH